MSNPFIKAARQSAKLKLAITGPSGSGKTTAALRCARGLVGEFGTIAVIDTENQSASLYSDLTNFDVLSLQPPFDDKGYTEAIKAAADNGYDAVIIDSASHLWQAILDYKTKLDKRGNSYANWGDAGAKLNAVLEVLLHSDIHVISCLRSKMEYAIEKSETGRTTIQKVGLAPIMRAGIEYEFTVVLDLDMEHMAAASKDRTRMFDGRILEIDEEIGKQLAAWLSGAEASGGDGKSTASSKQDGGSTPPASTNSKPETNPNRGKEARVKIDQAWKALGKTDADVPAACKFVGSEYVSFDGLSVAQLEKLLAELQRQMNAQAGKTTGQLDKEKKAKAESKKPEPDPVDEDVPMVHADDLSKKLPEDSEPQVNEYLVKLHWIKEGQTYRDLDAAKIEKILAKFDNFLRVAGVSQEAA